MIPSIVRIPSLPGAKASWYDSTGHNVFEQLETDELAFTGLRYDDTTITLISSLVNGSTRVLTPQRAAIIPTDHLVNNGTSRINHYGHPLPMDAVLAAQALYARGTDVLDQTQTSFQDDLRDNQWLTAKVRRFMSRKGSAFSLIQGQYAAVVDMHDNNGCDIGVFRAVQDFPNPDRTAPWERTILIQWLMGGEVRFVSPSPILEKNRRVIEEEICFFMVNPKFFKALSDLAMPKPLGPEFCAQRANFLQAKQG